MNKVNLLGRLTKDIEVKMTNSNKAYARFTLAVNRKKKKEEGGYEADFISCVAWEKTAEFLSKYFHKGSKLALSGRIQTGNYEKDGQKVYTTDVVVEEVEFVESKKDTAASDSEIEDTFGVAPSDEPQPNSALEIDESNLPFY